MSSQNVLFLELNEVNFEFIESYAAQGHLPNFKAFIDRYGFAETVSEKRYEELEPWIQWVTAHTGMTLSEHGIFRLGDIVNVDLEQTWERLAARGLTVGAISPLNAKCRDIAWDFFIPDPWTHTGIVANPHVKRLYCAISQVVNDNAQAKITPGSLVNLIFGGISAASTKNYLIYLNYIMQSRAKPWMKAIFLDQLLADLYIKSVSQHQTNFSTLFLNAGAHIQHHYMFSSAAYVGDMRNPEWYIAPGHDPLLDVYSAYDRILGRIITHFPTSRIMLATGLHQDPHPEVTYYWRIKDHAQFLRKIGVEFLDVFPRMSRDFHIAFATEVDAANAETYLNSAVADDGLALFEVDNQGTNLFVMLTYPSDVKLVSSYRLGNRTFTALADDVAFVAIKNGQHNGIGYFADNQATPRLNGTRFELAELPSRIMEAFGIGARARLEAA